MYVAQVATSCAMDAWPVLAGGRGGTSSFFVVSKPQPLTGPEAQDIIRRTLRQIGPQNISKTP